MEAITFERSIKKLHLNLQNKCQNFRKKYFQPSSNQSDLYTTLSERCVTKIQNNGTKIQIYIRQIPSPYINARYLANFIATKLENRIPFRLVFRTFEEQTKKLKQICGVRFQISGRLNGAEIARIEWIRIGSVSRHTLSINVDYSCVIARTIYGLFGVKVWVFQLFKNFP